MPSKLIAYLFLSILAIATGFVFAPVVFRAFEVDYVLGWLSLGLPFSVLCCLFGVVEGRLS